MSNVFLSSHADSLDLDDSVVLKLAIPPNELTEVQCTPEEGFLLSRINGHWDVRSILKLCPIPEDEVMLIFDRLLKRKVIALR